MTRRALPLLFCVALGFAVYAGLGEGQALRWDNGIQFFPLELEAFRQVRGRIVPGWNPFIWSGAPLLAEPSSQAAYPLMWLGFVLAGTRPTAMPAIAYGLHVILSSAGMYLLGRWLRLSRAGALLAAVVFAANPYYCYLATGFLVEFAVFAWLPLQVLCACRAAAGERPARWAALGALAAAAAWSAGHLQLWAYSAVAVMVCGIGLVPRRRGRAFWLAALPLLAGVCLVMFQVLPFLDLIRHSQRAQPFGIEEFLFQDIPLASWPAILVPGLGGAVSPVLSLAGNNYVHLGLLAVTLALVALGRPTRARVVLAALAVLGLWLASGRSGGLMPLVYRLPGMALLRNPHKFFTWPVFALAILAGAGLGDVERTPRGWHAVAVLAALGAAAVVWSTAPDVRPAAVRALAPHTPAVALAVTELTGLLFALQVARSARGRHAGVDPRAGAWTGALAVVGTLAVFAVEFSIYGRSVEASGRTVVSVIDGAPTHAGAVPPAESRGRAPYVAADGWRTYWAFSTVAGPVPGDLRGALGAYWQTEMATGYTSFIEPVYNAAIGYWTVAPARPNSVQRLLRDENGVLDVLATRYTLMMNNRWTARYLAKLRSHARGPHHEPRDLGHAVLLLENRRVLPRVRFVARVEGAGSRAEALRATVHGRVDPAEVAVVEGAARGPLAACAVRVARSAPGAVDLWTTCPADAFVVLAERADAGWHARLDGAPGRLERCYGLVLGLALPRGMSHVELRYRPPGFAAGLVVAGLTAVVLLAAMILERRSGHTAR